MGNQQGVEDDREHFGAFLDVVDRLRPLFVEIENVLGLQKPEHGPLRQSLQARLEASGYAVKLYEVDASRFEVPQQRKRVLILASRWGLPRAPTPPAVVSKTAGEALKAFDSFGEKAEPSLVLTEKAMTRHAKYEATASGRPSHVMADRPARTVTPGNLRAHGKDAMRILKANGQQRILSVPEAAALQSFPQYFSFNSVSDSRARLLIGNAYPPMLGFHLSEHWRRLHALGACLYARCYSLMCALPSATPRPSLDEALDLRVATALMEALRICPTHETLAYVHVEEEPSVFALNPYGGAQLPRESAGGRLLYARGSKMDGC